MNAITAVLFIVIALAAAAGVVRYTVLRRTAESVPRRVRIAAGLAALLLLILVAVQTLRPIALVRDPGITMLQPIEGAHPTTNAYSAYDGPLLFTVLLVRSPGDSLTGYGYRGAQDADLVAVTQVHGAAKECVHVPVHLDVRLGWRDEIHITVQPDGFFHTWQDDPSSEIWKNVHAHPDPWFTDVRSVGFHASIIVQRTTVFETWSNSHEIDVQGSGKLWQIGTGWQPRRLLQLGGCRITYKLIVLAQPLTDAKAYTIVSTLPAVDHIAASWLEMLPYPEAFGNSSYLDHRSLALATWAGMTGVVLIAIAMLGACMVTRWSLAFGINVLLVLVFACVLDRIAVGLELGRIGRLATPADLAHIDLQTYLLTHRTVSDAGWEFATAQASFFHHEAAYSGWMAKLP